MSAGLMSCVRENSPPITMENSGAASLSSESQGMLYIQLILKRRNVNNIKHFIHVTCRLKQNESKKEGMCLLRIKIYPSHFNFRR